MLKILEYVKELSSDTEKEHIRALISVSSSSDLATETDKYVFTEASIAWDISTSKIYGLVGGSWVEQ